MVSNPTGRAKSNQTRATACFVERSDILETLLQEVGASSPQAHTTQPSQSSIAASASDGRSVISSRSQVSQVKAIPGSSSSSTSRKGSFVLLSTTSISSGAAIQAKMQLDRARIQRTADKDKRFADLQSAMDESLDFLENVDRDLSLVDETRRTKTRRQFEDWNKNVHGKIQSKVLTKVNSISPKELHERYLDSYDKFLSITNRKPAIFRDIIIESEYDPLEVNRSTLKANFSRIKDPLKIDKQKAENEMAMVGLKLHDGVSANDRLEPVLWAKGKIESTPYGMFASLMTPEDEKEGHVDGVGYIRPESKQRAEREKKQRTSNVVFDDFNYPLGKSAVDKEMPPPKPRMRKIYTDPKALVTDPKTGGSYPMSFQRELHAIGTQGWV